MICDLWLLELVRRYGVTAKLRRAVERERGWRGDDWYRHWPTFGLELERVVLISTSRAAAVVRGGV